MLHDVSTLMSRGQVGPDERASFFESEMPGSPNMRASWKSLHRFYTYHQVHSSYQYLQTQFHRPRCEGSYNDNYGVFVSHQSLASPCTAIPELGRSGHRIQMSYALRTALRSRPDATEMTRRDRGGMPTKEIWDLEGKAWRIHQAIIHHQFDLVSGTSVWMITSCQVEMEGIRQSATWEEYLNPLFQQLASANPLTNVPAAFKTSLRVHLRLVRWSLGDWMELLDRNEENLSRLVRHALR